MLHDFCEKSKKRVCLVTAGHDFDRTSHSYDDEGEHQIEGTKFSELYDFYKDFGYKDAIEFNEKETFAFPCRRCASFSNAIILLAKVSDKISA